MIILLYVLLGLFSLSAFLPIFMIKESLLRQDGKKLTKDVIYKMIIVLVINLVILWGIILITPIKNQWFLIPITFVDVFVLMAIINTKYFLPKNEKNEK